MNMREGGGASAQQLKEQRFQMLEDIARELAGEVCFPTCFDIAIRVRNVLRDPNVSLDQVAAVVRLDPLLSARLMRLANSAIYNGGGRPVLDVKSALSRIGLNLARTTALGLAMDQLMRSRELAAFGTLATLLWEHSLTSAAGATVLARHFTRISPEEAFTAGLIHDIGAFYMLYRACQYPELRERPDTLQYVIVQWHESIGESLVAALGLPEAMAEAVRDHDHPRPPVDVPRTLSDVVYVANLLAGAAFEWQRKDLEEGGEAPAELGNPQYLALMDEITAVRQELAAALK